ncbi:uncharacterized protein H6S33_000577 [Morchella sextelata]|uniref:uncharacterized protein n=1 Tax=Morchella sextelata TaxID=1174677 RepID=UPI001D036825|nr:uncharacterized protein H6S33_000577 [Morchella sextelata]KAH0614941.1 hypothetical protein H6S33_000577 [Morchella sextelata]
METPARSSRAHRLNRGPLYFQPWSLPAVAIVLVVVTMLSGRAVGELIQTGDNGDLINRSGLVMSTTDGTRTYSVPINQLPLDANHDQANTRKVKNFVNNLVLYTSDTDREFSTGNLAFISCDSSNGNNASAAFLKAISQKPQPYCVIFYTVEHDYCDYNPQQDYNYDLVFTTLDRESANDFQLLMNTTGDKLDVTINYDSSVEDQPTQQDRNSLSSNQNNSVLGPSPSTSVALIILYSITGVITALFLLIILIGAIRAHRHPERYGPRAPRFGRPRQSRAKGLARAVLDTLPIVRFGDPPAPEGANDGIVKPTDLEMAPDSITSRTSEDDRRRSVVPSVASQSTPSVSGIAPVSGEDAAAREGAEPAVMSTSEMDPSQLRCPVCMEDFESGVDLRVLPCHHSFHPDCIDPWLLNVAGSCPLCRIDLRPEDQRQSIEVTPPPAPEPVQSGSRIMRYLDIARGSSSSDERMAALRQLREENGTRPPRSRAPELGISRLRRVFNRRMSGSRAGSSVTVNEPAPPAAEVAGAETARGGVGLTTINSADVERPAPAVLSDNSQR